MPCPEPQNIFAGYFLAATGQLYEQACPSICPMVSPFLLSVCPGIIITFSGVIAIDQSSVHTKGQGRGSEGTVTETKTNFIPIWTFPHCNSNLNLQLDAEWCIMIEGV